MRNPSSPSLKKNLQAPLLLLLLLLLSSQSRGSSRAPWQALTGALPKRLAPLALPKRLALARRTARPSPRADPWARRLRQQLAVWRQQLTLTSVLCPQFQSPVWLKHSLLVGRGTFVIFKQMRRAGSG